MKYRVTIDGRDREVDVILSPGGGVTVSLDGTPVQADARRVRGGVSLSLGGKVYDVALGGPADAMDVAIGDRRARVGVISPRARARGKKGAGLGSGGDEIRAPMPGRIVAVLVEAGQEVAEGDPCVVIEAMKMENELRAPKSGTIGVVHTEVGVSVDGRALLVSFA